MENITQGDLIIVKWRDTWDNSSWENIEYIKTLKPPVAKHVGWFLDEDDECIRGLYSTVGHEGDIEAGRWIIYKQSIVSIEKIREDELEPNV